VADSVSWDDCARRLALRQGLYYVATGTWPLLHMRSFERVTGPKNDKWLVKTVGLLVATIGVALWAGSRARVPPAIRILGGLSALALAGVDVNYSARGRISPIYLLDAGAELVLALGWGLSRRGGAASGQARAPAVSARKL
jgi:hypothetical protein